MISIDRTSSVSFQEQLAEQLRFHVARGRHKVGDMLPSTRKLAEQLDISFHTVRKAYHQLQEEGLIRAEKGAGFIVEKRAPLSREDRMEQGAGAAHEWLQKMIGLGLEAPEIEYLVQEQLELIGEQVHALKLLCAASYRELAESLAQQVNMTLQQQAEPVLIDDLHAHQDADFLFARCSDLQKASRQLPRVDMLGIVTYLSPHVLQRIARLLDTESLGVLTYYEDALPPLMAEIRMHTGFSGQTMGASISESDRHLHTFVDQSDLLVYTPRCKRRLARLLEDASVPSYLIEHIISHDSDEAIRESVPA